MPISGINSLPLLPAASPRATPDRASDEQARTERNRVIERSPAPNLPELNILEPEALQLSPQQRVTSSSRDESSSFEQQSEQEGLNFNARQALKTFAENTPSPEQRLGIDLAGIDTFA